MKNLNALADECVADLESIGVQVKPALFWSVNTTAKHRWGQCKCLIPGEAYSISISQSLLEDDLDDMAAKNTIMHEILHALTRNTGHKGRWLQMANKVNCKLPQYTIKRTTSAEEKGIEENPFDSRYVIRCNKCGKIYTRDRKCRLTENPEIFRCGRCNESSLIRIK